MRYLPAATFCVLAIVLGIILFDSHDAMTSTSPMLNKPISEFKIEALEPNTFLSSKDFKNHYVLLNFFASWCSVCVAENPQFLELSKDKRLDLYGIAWRDSKDRLKEWLANNGNPYKKIGFDSEGKTNIDFGVTAVPETFLISPKGIILYHHLGPVLKKDLPAILSLIKAEKK